VSQTRQHGCLSWKPGPDDTHSISAFITTHADQDRPGAGPFEVENRATLQVNLQGTVYAKAGAMVAYRSDIKFSRKGTLEDGVGKFLKKAVTGEGMALMKMEVKGAWSRLTATLQINTSNPFLSNRFSSLSDGPLGCLSPISHCRTVDRLVLSTDARTAWLSLCRARSARILALE
jgi:Mitochondrial biogenesis AIM24